MTSMRRESDRAWIWSTNDIAVDRRRGTAMVEVAGADRRPGESLRECAKARIEIPWRARRSGAAARQDALRRLQSVIDEEIRALSAKTGGR